MLFNNNYIYDKCTVMQKDLLCEIFNVLKLYNMQNTADVI